jgi:hypothetical protein
MNIQLPSINAFQQQCRHEDGWSDHYGALHVSATYSGLVMPPQYRIKAIWQHGCIGPWEATSPGPLVFNSPAARDYPLYVARTEEADYLIAHGYPQARAIGLPIVYTPPSGLARQPGTLLVMPTHTLVGATFGDRHPFEEYADEINTLRPRFERVVVCVHPACQQNGLWIKEFSERGFEILFGAHTSDRNALSRMRALFEQVEAVTSNGWGSHIAYGLAFGAKVSIFGKEVAITEAEALRDQSWAAAPDTLKAQLSPETDRNKRNFLSRLYRQPDAGLLDVEFGRWLIGAGNRLDEAEMALTLGSMLDPAPVSAMVRRAQFQQARDASISRARLLMQAERQREAIQFLLREAGRDIASKEPQIIHDGLTQYAEVIAPVEGELAAKLRNEAAALAAAHTLPVASQARGG